MTELSKHWGDWPAYFREINAQRAEDAATKVTDEPDEVLAPFVAALPTSAPAAPKRLHMRLSGAGWEVWMEQARTRQGRKFFKSGDKEGELKSEPFDLTHWQVRARLRDADGMIAALKVSWVTKHREKDATAFDHAVYWDCAENRRVYCATAGEFNSWLSVIVPARKGEAA